MKPIRAMVAVVFVLGFALAAPVLSADDVGSFTELTLEISLDKTAILPFEAVRMTTNLTNTTGRSVWGHGGIRPGGGYLDVFIAPEDKSWMQVELGTTSLANTIYVRRPLPSGCAITGTTLLWWGDTPEGDGRALFGAPGNYRVKVVLYDVVGERKVSISSNVATLEVVEPTGREAEPWACLKQLSSKGCPLFAGTGISGFRRMSELKQFASEFPESVYAAYAWYAIGTNYIGTVSRSDEAVLAFENVFDRTDFVLREAALYGAVLVAANQRKVEKAQGYLTILKRDYPDSPYMSSFQDAVRRAARKK